MVEAFRTVRRNDGHWDIWVKKSRAFRIRGGVHCPFSDGPTIIIGEHEFENATKNDWMAFKTLTAAMAWITDYLMHEPVKIEGDE